MSIDIFPTLHLLPRPGLTPGALAVSRPGTATRIDALGRVETLGADVLRHDFDRATGQYKGWLVEEERTNLLLRSRDPSAGGWTRSGVTVALDQRGLDGAAGTAASVAATVAGGALYQSVTATEAAYTLSVDLRRLAGSGPVALTLDGGATWSEVTGALDAGTATGDGVRVSLTRTLANPTIGLRLGTAGDAVAADFWQLEAGGFATSRIPTTTAPVTRGADLLLLDPAGGWFNPDAGTVYVEAAVAVGGESVKTLVSSADDPDAVECSVNEPAQGIHVNSGAIASGWSGETPSGRAVTVGAPFRLALAYGLSGGAFVHDGAVFQTYAVGRRWDTGRLALGCRLRGGAQRFFNGHIRHVAYFPRRLDDAQAVEVTAL